MGWAERQRKANQEKLRLKDLNRHNISPKVKQEILGEKLQFIYSKIPKVKCKGYCSSYCSAIGLEKIEVLNILDKYQEFEGQKQIRFGEPQENGLIKCGYLDSNDRCSIYDRRPILCRLFGATEIMLQCPMNCELEDGEIKISWDYVLTLFTEIKMLNTEFHNPEKVNELQTKIRNNQPYDLQDYIDEPEYNVLQELWQKDLESEELKTKVCLEKANGGQAVNMETYRLNKKLKLLLEIKESLNMQDLPSPPFPKAAVSVFNTDTMTEQEFTKDELRGLTDGELFIKIFGYKL